MKILYVTTIGKTMRFFSPFIRLLLDEGHLVELAANAEGSPVPECYREWGCKFHQVGFSRSPMSPDNVKAFGQLKKLVEEGEYDIVHCHTPNASVVTRMVCRKLRKKTGLKVFYTAHGFHFYKGAPVLNWLVFYPIEKFCSFFTDKLITINKEDYALAMSKFHSCEVHYVPGVGIDLSRFTDICVDRATKRCEIGVPERAFLLLSVGELNNNKNHQIVIRALEKLRNPNVHYAIAGRGDNQDRLLELTAELGVSEQVHLLGYRNDIPELNRAADVFCFRSRREGLGISAIEAMACGLPLITSNVHGINDYSENDISGYKCAPNDIQGFSEAIEKLASNPYLCKKLGEANALLAYKYEISTINQALKNIYES